MFNSDSSEGSGEREVVETWQRFVQGLLGVLALLGAGTMVHNYAPPKTDGLEQQVHQLSRQVADLERQQSFSSAAVDNARDSVAYIYGIYHVSGRVAKLSRPGRWHGFRSSAGTARHQSPRGRALVRRPRSRSRLAAAAARPCWKSWWHISRLATSHKSGDGSIRHPWRSGRIAL